MFQSIVYERKRKMHTEIRECGCVITWDMFNHKVISIDACEKHRGLLPDLNDVLVKIDEDNKNDGLEINP